MSSQKQENGNLNERPVANNARLSDIMDLDREEGELSESGKPSGFVRPPPTGPRKRKLTPPASGRNNQPFGDARNGKKKRKGRAAGQTAQPSAQAVEQHPAQTASLQSGNAAGVTFGRDFNLTTADVQKPNDLGHSSIPGLVGVDVSARAMDRHPADPAALQSQKEKVLPFVSAVHSSGYTFADLACELSNQKPLHDIYKGLHIPTTPPNVPLPSLVETNRSQRSIALPESSPLDHRQTDGASSPKAKSTKASDVSLSSKPPGNGIKKNVSSIKPGPPKPSTPMDRKDYLARLQAAKTKKTEPAAPKVSPDVAVHTAQPTVPAHVANLSSAEQSAANTPPLSQATARGANVAEKQNQSTELVRKKMEALKATRQHLARVNTPSIVARDEDTQSEPIDTSSLNPTPQPVDLPEAVRSNRAHSSADVGSPKSHAVEVGLAPPAVSSHMPGLTQTVPHSIIPGLYMAISHVSSSAAATVPNQPLELNAVQNAPSARALTGPALDAPQTLSSPQSPVQKDVQPNEGVASTIASEDKPNRHARRTAADMNEPDVSIVRTVSGRPFGQSRHDNGLEHMIIDISEDDNTDGEVDMELDEEDPASIPTMGTMTQKQTSIRELPTLRDFPARSTFNSAPSTSGVSTPIVGTPGTIRDTEELKRKEQEIAEMNLRIKAYEQRKAAMKARTQVQQSRPQTPSASKVSPLAHPSSGGALPASVPTEGPAVSDKIPTVGAALVDNATKEQVPKAGALAHGSESESVVQTTPQPAVPPNAITSSPVSVPSNAHVVGTTRSDRRTRLQSDLSARDLKISSQKAKLEEMRRQMAEMEMQYERDMKQQQQLRQELEGLDINTDGMTGAEMQAKKDEIDQQQQQQQQQLLDSQPTTESDVSSLNRHEVNVEPIDLHPAESTPTEEEAEPSAAMSSAMRPSSPGADSMAVEEGPSLSEDSSDEDEVFESTPQEVTDEAIAQEPLKGPEIASSPNAAQGLDTHEDADMDVYAPDPSQLEPASPESDGSSSMDMSSDTSSESDTDDHSPEVDEEDTHLKQNEQQARPSEKPETVPTEPEYEYAEQTSDVAAVIVLPKQPSLSQDATSENVAAISDVGGAANPEQYNVTDDLAPELQPMREQQMAVETAVSQARCVSTHY